MKDRILFIFSGFFSTIILLWVASLFLIQKVSTDSMAPTMPVGSYWLNIPVIYSYTPKVGDIVSYDCKKRSCYDKHGEFFTHPNGIQHRITNIDSNGCITIIGDNPKYNWDIPCYTQDEIEVTGYIAYLPFISPR